MSLNDTTVISGTDLERLRQLAGRYAELASLDVQAARLDRYRRTNALEPVRPVVLIDEVPWGEIRDDALVNTCAPELAWLETPLRQALYQWEHFQVDRVLPPVYRVAKRVRWLSGIGIAVQERQIKGDTGAYIAAHAYTDQLQSEADLSRLHEPEIEYDRVASEAALAVAERVFDGLMPVALAGMDGLQYNLWDTISALRGVENLLMDLAVRPAFMHQTAQRFTDIARSLFRQIEAQELLDPSPVLLHCTPATTSELPAPDFAGHVRACDVWGRCAAQIFGSVSPDMHDAFDLAYNQDLFKDCGLLYYGCCEPMDGKIDILRQRFSNLRKISITPWADPAKAAVGIGGDFVMAAKPNPAFVASRTFNPVPVKQEITRYCDACIAHRTPLEFVLKDISTIANQPATLTQWAATVSGVLDTYYGCPNAGL